MTTHWDGWAFDEDDKIVRLWNDEPAPGVVRWLVVCRGGSQRQHALATLCVLFDRRATDHHDVIGLVKGKLGPTADAQTRRQRQYDAADFRDNYPAHADRGATIHVPRCRVRVCRGGDDIQIGQERLAGKLDALEAARPSDGPRVVDAFLLR